MPGIPLGLLGQLDPKIAAQRPAGGGGIFDEMGRRLMNGRIAKSIKSGLTAPGDAYAGRMPIEDYPSRGADVAGLAMGGGLLAGPSEGAVANMGIRAFHGSPHKFDKFSMEKIGTGEGAQAYGHGLYFAENEGIARSYRDQLSNRKVLIDGRNMNSLTYSHDPRDALLGEIGYQATKGKSPEEAIKHLRQKYRHESTSRVVEPENQEWAKRLLTELDDIEKNPPKVEVDKGHMYEVELKGEPHEFLDYDEPLSAEMLDRVAAAHGGRDAALKARADLDALAERALSDPSASDAFFAANRAPPAKLGDLYSRLGRPDNQFGYSPSKSVKGQDLYHALGDPKAASAALKEAGIKGIRYKDAGSRGKDDADGTRNYVVFDDGLVDVKRIYANKGGAPVPGQDQDDKKKAQPRGFNW
jgi:hypothetical protein